MKRDDFDITTHMLVPKHTKLSDKEKADMMAKYNVTFNQLPKIMITDPAIAHLQIKDGDIIKIVRQSPTAGESIFFRGVINE